VEVIVAADARGALGVLGYAPDDDGIPVPELGLVLTRDAVVVRRGIPRVSPGEMLPAPAPFAIAVSGNVPFMALGIRSQRALSADDLSAIWPKGAMMGTKAVATARDRAGGALAVGLIRSQRGQEVQKLVLPAAQ
jgi:hypothetical protein